MGQTGNIRGQIALRPSSSHTLVLVVVRAGIGLLGRIMGPPPPPPPPPVLTAPTILPSRKWKTEDAPRRNNNPPPAPPKPTRPTMDAAALQHAAARLRKTGYNEPVRSDIESLSDGRVDRSDQRVPHRNWTHGAQHEQLQRNSPRETVYASSTRAYEPNPISDIHRNPNALNYQTTREAPVANYSSINKYQSSSPTLSSDTYVSPYSTKYSYPKNGDNFRSYHKDDDYFKNNTTYSNTNININNNNNVKKNNGVTVVEWSEPYDPSNLRPQSPIRNPREVIHEYSTTNYVFDEKPSIIDKKRARNFVQNSLAKQLRDESLTESQRAANRYQKSPSASSSSASLPFDVSKIVKDSYNGDEVDHLVHQMRNNLNNNNNHKSYSNQDYGSVVQYPRGSPAADIRQTNYTTHSTTTTRKIMNINICVGCGKEITADQPGCNAMNQIFHVDCFKCGRCSKTLAGSSFYNIDEKPTCESCYQDTLEKCTACHNAINDKLLRACGGTYHVNCFVCVSCKKSLDGVPFTLDKENSVHCVPCFHDKFAPRCAMCSKPIIPVDGEKESVRVVAMDKSFHVDCYKCEDCGLQLSSKLDGHGCYPIDQHLLCKTCNGNRLRVMSSS
ncbi:unnamed protein product [Caenorhabditis bovis]|uniref:LIM zinc-binding domain-containing protein n=1 Tax=Caenorhabditis bovis TaxID=2654633 RepID=A0A8S1EXJ0_9PELO|nr:unnamed protein product [Caenorhabditis bovis]